MAATYVEVIRNTPLLLQLYLIYFALPQAGVNLDPVAAGVLRPVDEQRGIYG